MTTRCAAKKEDGSRCKMKTPIGREFCIYHDPEKKEQLVEQCRRGGLAKAHRKGTDSQSLPPEEAGDIPRTIDELKELVSKTIYHCLIGNVDHRRANAIRQLAQVATKLFGAEGDGRKRNHDIADDQLLASLKEQARIIENRLKGGNGHAMQQRERQKRDEEKINVEQSQTSAGG